MLSFWSRQAWSSNDFHQKGPPLKSRGRPGLVMWFDECLWLTSRHRRKTTIMSQGWYPVSDLGKLHLYLFGCYCYALFFRGLTAACVQRLA